MTWFYLSLTVAVFYTCLNIFSRVVSVDSKNPRALSLAFNLTSLTMAVILLLVTGSFKNISLPTKAEAWIYLLIAAFFYGVFERLRFYTTKLLDASTYSIISNTTVITAFSLSLFLYRETLSFSKLCGFFLIMISLFLVVENLPAGRQGKKSKVSLKGILIGLITSIAVGIGMGLDKKGANYFNPEIYNLLIWTVPITVVFFPFIKIEEIKDQFKKFSWKIILLSLFNFIGFYLSLKAYLLADATKVILIIQLSTIMTVIAGAIFLNEKSHLAKKILAGIIAFLGVLLLR